jgi:GNAT superfamily N-acetyltransferase
MGPDERRAAAFARWFDERMCTRIGPWRWGTLYLDAEFPDVSDSNFLSVEGAPADGAPNRVVAEAERVRVEVGIPHRRAVVAEAGLADRLAPAFERAGWRAERYRLMVQRRVPEAPPDAPPAGEVPFAELMRFRDDLTIVAGKAGESLGTHRAYVEKTDRSIGTRCFLARIDGRAVGGCVLWAHGADAQLDAVATLPSFRGRGAAGAAAAAASEAARKAGATWIHLYTNAETGPTSLYRRLGFDDVGVITEFSGG